MKGNEKVMYSVSRYRQHLGQHEKALSVAKQIFMHEGF